MINFREFMVAPPESEGFQIGDKVVIHNPDFRGDIAVVVGFKNNMLEKPLVVVKREASSRTTVFYPHELKKLS